MSLLSLIAVFLIEQLKPLDYRRVIAEPLEIAATRTATVIGFVHFFVMLLTLTIYANLIQLSPNYARAAQDLGAGRIATFRHVILPLTLPVALMINWARAVSSPSKLP